MSRIGRSISEVFNSPRFSFGGNGSFFPKLVFGWNAIGQVMGLAQVILGAILLSTSTTFLINQLRFFGQLIGILSIIVGVVGLLSLRLKRVPMQMLFIVAMGFMAMMSFEFTVQVRTCHITSSLHTSELVKVGRDVDVHCGFAETYTRIAHLEEMLTEMRHDEMSLQLFERLNEIDDMIDMVREGDLESITASEGQQAMIGEDVRYITAKMNAVRRHADQALNQLHSMAQETTNEMQLAKDKSNLKQNERMRAAIVAQIEGIENALRMWDAKKARKERFTFADYEQLLNTLSGNQSFMNTVEQEKEQLRDVHAAWRRYAMSTSNPLEKRRSEQRQLFESIFHRTIDAHQETTKPRFRQRLRESLEDLPEQCLRENGHLTYFLCGGWLLIAVQIATAYVSSTSLFVSNGKKDY